MKEITLYHGSKGGIVGNIEPNSRIRCDFGKGFYMGTKPEQAKTLVYHDAMPIFYTMQFKLQNKRTNSKADLFAHLFGQFVNCIQHIIIV